jgi:uncharacterized membrane protein SpoIIM required for sporulation
MSSGRSPDYDSKIDEDARQRPSPPAGQAPVLEPTEARQGITHHNVRIVLAVSVGVLVIAYVIIYLLFFH